MSDLVVNIRQIGSYPAPPGGGPALVSDAILIQRGGLGGPYYQTTPEGLLAFLANGQTPPADAAPDQLFVDSITTPVPGEWFWNAYRDTNGVVRVWEGGKPQAELSFDANNGWLWAPSPASLHTDDPADFSQPAATLTQAGDLTLPLGTLTVSHDPIQPYQVVTLHYAEANQGIIDIGPESTPPPATSGRLWFNTDDLQTYIFYVDPTGPGQWIPLVNQVGPAGPPGPPGGIGEAPNVPGLFLRDGQHETWVAYTQTSSPATPSDALPIMDGTAAAGTATPYSRADHVHPHDTSKANTQNPILTAPFEVPLAMAANDIDCNAASVYTKTITGATTLTVSNVPPSGTVKSFLLELINAGTNITWWPNVRWPGATKPTLSLTGIDVLGFYTYNGGATWTGLLLARSIG